MTKERKEEDAPTEKPTDEIGVPAKKSPSEEAGPKSGFPEPEGPQNPESAPRIDLAGISSPEGEKERLVRETAALLNVHRRKFDLPQTRRVIDKMGYRTNIQNGKMLNMARLIAGSEGTLGVITAVKLQLPEIPPIRKAVLLLFSSMEKAMRAVPFLLPFHL